MDEAKKELEPAEKVAKPAQKAPEDVFLSVSEASYPGWERSMTRLGETWINKAKGLFAVFGGKQIDGKHWVMLMVFRKSRLPSTEDIAFAKKTFIGENNDALLLLPGAVTRYFSEPQTKDNTTVRIVSCVEGDGIPKFF